MIQTSWPRICNPRIIFAFGAICVVALAISMLAAPAVGLEDPHSFKDKSNLDGGSGQAFDKACVTCHSNLNPQEQHRWIGLNQASTFLGLGPDNKAMIPAQPDVHAMALTKVYKNGDRNGPLTEAFESILNHLDIDKGSVGFRSQCLTCHAGLRPDQSGPTTPGRTYAQFQSEGEPIARESIGCEACHGQGKDYLVDHMDLSWISNSPSAKLGKGFYDLENSALAARVCLSCHFGNPEESKWITHEMYAAGHPPLPPLDLGKFLDGTFNKHWMTLEEKSNRLATLESEIDKRLADDRIKYLRIHLASNTSDHSQLKQTIQTHFRKTQQSRIGQWTANLNYHDLLEQQAHAATNWGDYALYDCAGCHQTLYKKMRGTVGSPRRVPGRPQGPLWTKPLPSSPGDSPFMRLVTLQDLIDEAFNAKPFGDRGKIQSAIEGSASDRAKAKSQLIELAGQPLDPSGADEWLRGFLEQRQGMLGNRWAANQTYWTLEMYFDDLANVSKAIHPQEVKNQKFQARFQELKSQAPDFFQIGAFGDTAENSHFKPIDSAFYERLEAFIDTFLAADATDSY